MRYEDARRGRAGAQQLLIDLGPVTVHTHRVRPAVLVHLGKQLLDLRAPAGARGAGLGVDDHRLADEPRARQRHQSQERAGRVATRNRDQARVPEFLAVELRQSVHGPRQQLRRRVLSVPAGVDRSIPQPAIGGHVEHAAPIGEHVADEWRRRAVRQRGEDDVGGRLAPGFRLGQLEVDDVGEEGIDLRRTARAVLLRGEEGDLHIRMPGQEPEQLHAGIAGRAQHRDANAS